MIVVDLRGRGGERRGRENVGANFFFFSLIECALFEWLRLGLSRFAHTQLTQLARESIGCCVRLGQLLDSFILDTVEPSVDGPLLRFFFLLLSFKIVEAVALLLFKSDSWQDSVSLSSS